MAIQIKIITKYGELVAELNSTNTAEKISDALPFESRIKTWGEEVYFKIPVNLSEENATLHVEVGDIAYWLEGKCFCIFFGRTPMSVSEKPRPYSPVNICGRVTSNLEIIKKVKDGEKISVERR